MQNTAIEREIMIDGRPVKFRASAATPRYYRTMCGRDIYRDMAALSDDLTENGSKDGSSTMSITSLEIFENVSYIMAKQADPDIPDIDEWLDSFSMFSIYEIMPQIVELWGVNTATMETSKKKQGQRQGK